MIPSQRSFHRAWFKFMQISRRNRSFGNYRSYSTQFRSNERLWAVTALTIAIPTLVWIYNRHHDHTSQANTNAEHGALATVIIDDLKELQGELGKKNAHNAKHDIGISISPTEPLIHAKYVLVGGGTASFAALEEISRLEPGADVLMISEESNVPYMRPPLSKEIWFNIEQKDTESLRFSDWHGEEKTIFYQDPSFFELHNPQNCKSRKPRLLLGKTAIKLDTDAHIITLDDGQSVQYEKLLIATGGKPKELIQLQDASPAVRAKCFTFRGVQDLQQLLAVLKPSGRIAIVGGGFLGSELAVALAQYSRMHLNSSLHITQLFPEDGNMALVFPRYLSRWTMNKIKRCGVQVLPNTRISTINLNRQGQLHLQLSNDGSKVLDVDHLIVAIGIEPNVALAQSAGLEVDHERGGIITNAYLDVCKDVHAAGDAISFHDPGLGIRRRVEHYDHAVLSGRMAAHNMVSPSGDNKRYAVQSMFWSDLGPEIGYEAVGLVDSKLTTVGVWAEASPEDSPRAADLDTTDIRTQSLGRVNSRAADPIQDLDQLQEKQPSIVPTPQGNKTYGKGVVFYIKDRRIVGLLMFNLFNRLELARDIIKKHTSVEDLEALVSLFNIYNNKVDQQLMEEDNINNNQGP